MAYYYVPIINHCQVTLKDIFWNDYYDPPAPGEYRNKDSSKKSSLSPVSFASNAVGSSTVDKTQFTFLPRKDDPEAFLTKFVLGEDDNGNTSSSDNLMTLSHADETTPTSHFGTRAKIVEAEPWRDNQPSVSECPQQPSDATLTPAVDSFATIPSPSSIQHDPPSEAPSGTHKRNNAVVKSSEGEIIGPRSKRIKTQGEAPQYRSYHKEIKTGETVRKELVYECNRCNYKCNASGDMKKHRDTHLAPQYHCKKLGCPCIGTGLWATRESSVRRHFKTQLEKKQSALQEIRGTTSRQRKLKGTSKE
ncbi:hypothetical protein CPB84DRAFT_1787865 [Gymnopilus junonius]|uniref:C2H2-type domain-containing protein n=1 Tax=Gymnopilus junonius TaxID=109634 RepID=A0A9P5TIV2_GYMJU|nr:hypothetical protein CPB84DRAFT_1787865 [Gymnopilus junonius]